MKQIGVALFNEKTGEYFSGFDYGMCDSLIPSFGKIPLVYDSISAANTDKFQVEKLDKPIKLVYIYTD